MKKILPIIILLSFVWACEKDSAKPSSIDSSGQKSGNVYLNDNIILPPGSFQVPEDSIFLDTNIRINNNGNNPAMVVEGGENLTIDIDFNAVSSDVSHAGIRFGDSGPITMIPIANAVGNSSGRLSFGAQIPSGLCSNIDEICHDVKCYEFAVAESPDGTFRISKSNINDLVASCGACDSPSCMALLTEPCDSTSGGGSNSSTLAVNGVSKNILYVYCEFYPTDNDTWVGAEHNTSPGSFYFNIVINGNLPLTTKTFNLVSSISNSSTEAEMLYDEEDATGDYNYYDAGFGGTVTYIVNGSNGRWSFNNVSLKSEDGLNPINVSGEIICP